MSELINYFLLIYLAWSVVNQLLPTVYQLALLGRREGVYFAIKGAIITLTTCLKCLCFWIFLIATGSIYVAAGAALIAQLISHRL